VKKIISLFKRDYEGNRQVFDEVVEGAEWVVAGEGAPTEKIDGTCCLIENGKLFKRYEVKKGKKAPPDFVAASDVDPNTGKQQGWRPVGDGPEDKWHREAWSNTDDGVRADGTYELVGPKVQGNPYSLSGHGLWRHGGVVLSEATPRTFEGLKEFFAETNIEGIVWHHPDGRMVKIKKRDFGFKWPEPSDD